MRARVLLSILAVTATLVVGGTTGALAGPATSVSGWMTNAGGTDCGISLKGHGLQGSASYSWSVRVRALVGGSTLHSASGTVTTSPNGSFNLADAGRDIAGPARTAAHAGVAYAEFQMTGPGLTTPWTAMRTTCRDVDTPGVACAASGSSHLYDATLRTWTEARDHAASLGGTLVQIDSSGEQDCVWALLQEPDPCPWGTCAWAGGNDLVAEGTWRWVAGSAFGYTNWFSGEPNSGMGTVEEDCLEVAIASGGSRGWNDAICTLARPSVIEFGG